MSPLVTLRSFDNYVTAHIVKSRLEAEGIVCTLKDEHTVIMQWTWANAIGGIKLQVLEREQERAEEILRQTEEEALAERETVGFWEEDTEQLDPGNRVCIHCGSRNTRKDDYEKKPAILSWLLLGFPILFRSDKWHCFHCGEKF
jgi:hypothetical protein